MAVARVLVDSPLPQLDRLFDYLIPDDLATDAAPGVRVTVPLRTAGRLVGGFLVEVVDDVEFAGSLSAVESVVSPARVLAPEVWALARRVADRQAGGASDVLRLAIPPRSVRVEKQWLARPPVESPALPTPPLAGYPASLAEVLDAGGRVALRAVPQPVRLPDGTWVGHWAATLAAAALRAASHGSSAIIAVADYRDQEQVAAAVRALGGASVLSELDARQPAPQRYAAFLSCLDDAPRVIVGPRSAVYAPAARLGLIALFDDGDPLYAEPLAPYAHARDVALIRQEQQGAALVLAGHTRSVEAQRLTELGWLVDVQPAAAVQPHVVPTAFQSGEAQQGGRIPTAAWRVATDALRRGPVLVQVARPGDDRSIGGSQVTATDLGRAFPGVRVLVSDGERPLTRVGATPALVIATRAAEPVADGGYAAVLLLDGERMLLRESLRVAEDCLRWWSNAAALAAPGAPVVLVGVGGALADALLLWRQAEWASAELAERRALGMPPALRAASVTGTVAAVEGALTALEGLPVTVDGPVTAEARPGDAPQARAIVRFDYAHGPQVAAALRGALVRSAQSGRRPKGRRPAPTLRVKLDDPEAF